jgi:hypothetical protein
MTQPRRHLPEIAKMVYIAPQHGRLTDNVQRHAPGQTSRPALRTPASMATMRKPEEKPCHSFALFTHTFSTPDAKQQPALALPQPGLEACHRAAAAAHTRTHP